MNKSYIEIGLSFVLGSTVELFQISFHEKNTPLLNNERMHLSKILSTGILSSGLMVLKDNCFSYGAIPITLFVIGGNELAAAGLIIDLAFNMHNIEIVYNSVAGSIESIIDYAS